MTKKMLKKQLMIMFRGCIQWVGSSHLAKRIPTDDITPYFNSKP